MKTIPSDTSMREILDPVDPDAFRSLFKDCFRPLQIENETFNTLKNQGYSSAITSALEGAPEPRCLFT